MNYIMIFKFLAFCLSFFGYCIFINYKFKIKKEFTAITMVSCISIIMTFAGILNILRICQIIIYLGGFLLLIYTFKQNKRVNYLSTTNILFSILILYFAIISTKLHLFEYDNFSHWALIEKSMLNSNMLPNFSTNYIMFKSYPPATACFIYYFCKCVGQAESCYIFAQIFISLTAFFTMFTWIKNESKLKILPVFILLISVFVITTNTSYSFYELLVDQTLTLVGIASILNIFYNKSNFKQCFYLNIIFSMFLILIKNSGIYFVIINFIALLYFILKSKTFTKKQILKYMLLSVLILIFTLLIWKQHVKYVYGSEAIYSKHSMSVSAYISEFRSKDNNDIKKIVKNFVRKSIKFDSNNISIKILLYINVTSILYCLYCSIKNKNIKSFFNNFKYTFALDLIYLTYLLSLLGMYLFSMPTSEAITLDGFGRYNFTIVSYLLCLYTTGMTYLYYKNNESTNKFIVVLILISIFFTTHLIIQNKNNKCFIGVDYYSGSAKETFDSILQNKSISPNESYIIYAPKSITCGYLSPLANYMLLTNRKTIIESISEDIDTTPYKFFIVFDEDEYIKNYFVSQNIHYNGIGIYSIN